MEFKRLPGLTPDGTIYRNDNMGTLEALIPSGSYQFVQAPSLLELPGGDLLCAWSAGSYEGSADESIVCARLIKGEDHWKKPVKVSRDSKRSEQNPSLFLGPDNTVWSVYTAQSEGVSGKSNMHHTSMIRFQKSFDGGRTWEEARGLFPDAGSLCSQPIKILQNGRLIFSNWISKDLKTGLTGEPTVFRISDDEGASWKTVFVPESQGRIQANVVELEQGRLIAFMRSRFADFIYRSESFDWGSSWSSPVKTILPNNNSGISAVRLASGRIALAYNPTSGEQPATGKDTLSGHCCPVTVALSGDGGVTWPYARHMEFGEGFAGEGNQYSNGQYENPCLLQGEDEDLHLVFTYKGRVCIKYMRFTENDIIGDKRAEEK